MEEDLRKDTVLFGVTCFRGGSSLLNPTWGIIPPRHSMLRQPPKKSMKDKQINFLQMDKEEIIIIPPVPFRLP
jgi:hypothetical protein